MSWVLIKGSKFKHSLIGSDLSAALAGIKIAKAATDALLQNIALEVEQDVPGLPSIQAFLNSSDARLCCALEAAKKIPACSRPKLETVLAIPNLVNLTKALTEKCQLRVREKKKGQFRFIFIFRLVHRTAQQMILRAMQKLYVPRYFQHVRLQDAISLAKAGLLQGKLHYATLDIKDHNGSFSTKKLAAQLPVPLEWVNYVVGGRHTVVDEKEIDAPPGVLVSLHHTLLLQARRGLPCGSICSPIIAAYSISHLQWETTEGCLLINYADNFLLLASTSSMLENNIVELSKAVGKLPGGKFTLKLEQKGHATDGLNFLGHNLTAVSEVEIRISPSSYKSIYRLATAASKGIAIALSCGNVQKARDHCAPVKGWFISFSACNSMAEFEESIIAGIAQNALLPVDVIKDLMQSAQGQYKFLNDDFQSGT